MTSAPPSIGIRQRGFSYVEILLSVILLGLLLVPALEALQSGISGNHSHSLATRQLRLAAKMEEIAAKPFAMLYAQTYLPGGNSATSVNASLSDPAGTPDRRAVVLYRYDPSARALSASDTGVVVVSVTYAGESAGGELSTLVGRWW